jgi:hypothetical protein
MELVGALQAGVTVRAIGTNLTVGGETVSLDEARGWTTEYSSGGPARRPPAYDRYPGADTVSVGPQDLLAAALLNVSNKPLRVHYGLEGQMELLNERLRHPT